MLPNLWPCVGTYGVGSGKHSALHQRGPCRASVGLVWESLRISGLGAVSARSKSKREKVPGLLLHPGTAHHARQCRSRRAFSGFRDRNQKGVAKFVF